MAIVLVRGFVLVLAVVLIVPLVTAVAIVTIAVVVTIAVDLVDKFCGAAGISKMDGSDEINAPWDHTVACQIACAKGGYGMMIKEDKAFKFTPFDQKGNELATQVLKATKKTKGPTVMVMGAMKDGVIQVTSLVESDI